jgi:hypothetical protein
MPATRQLALPRPLRWHRPKQAVGLSVHGQPDEDGLRRVPGGRQPHRFAAQHDGRRKCEVDLGVQPLCIPPPAPGRVLVPRRSQTAPTHRGVCAAAIAPYPSPADFAGWLSFPAVTHSNAATGLAARITPETLQPHLPHPATGKPLNHLRVPNRPIVASIRHRNPLHARRRRCRGAMSGWWNNPGQPDRSGFLFPGRRWAVFRPGR